MPLSVKYFCEDKLKVVNGKYKEIIEDLVPLIKEELNIKEVEFRKDLSEFMNYELKPDFKVAGRILGGKIKDFQKFLQEVDAKEFVSKLNETIQKIKLKDEDTEIKREYVEVRVSAKEGFDVTMANNLFVILDTTITPELKSEGYAREFISKVQQMRKSNDYDILDNIIIEYTPTEEVEDAIKKFEDFIKDETLAVEIKINKSLEGEIVDLNGEEIKIKLEKK